MSGEDIHHNEEQQSLEGDIQSLADMPSFSEHMAENYEKSFNEAHRDGTLPEGVRDERDYQEYLVEQKAYATESVERLKESQEFIKKFYQPNEFTNHTENDLEEFIGSEELKAITENGFSLPRLAEKGIISSTDRWTNDGRDFTQAYWKHFKTDAIFQDAREIVGSLSMSLDYHDGEKRRHAAKAILRVFKKWDQPQTLDESDYDSMDELLVGATLTRFKFGNPEANLPNPETIDKSVYEHTMRTLEIMEASLPAPGDVPDCLFVANNILENKDIVIPPSHRKNIEAALGECINRNLGFIAEDMKYYDGATQKELKNLILRSLTKQDLFDPNQKELLNIKEDEDSYKYISISEDELLKSVYVLDYHEKLPTKYIGERDVDTAVLHDFPKLLEAGFNRAKLIDIIKESNAVRFEGDHYYGVRQAKKMREMGMDDKEIAYILYEGLGSPLDEGETEAAIQELGISENDLYIASWRHRKKIFENRQ